jgi:hypothetical protein
MASLSISDEELKIRQRNGGLSRAAQLTPEQRQEIASRAGTARWAAHAFLGLYPRKKSNIERVDWHLRALSRLMGKAIAESDFREARACIQAMLGAEKLKMWIEMNAGKPKGAALDVTEESEATQRLLDARKKRNQALGLDDSEEVVIDAATETDK